MVGNHKCANPIRDGLQAINVPIVVNRIKFPLPLDCITASFILYYPAPAFFPSNNLFLKLIE